MLKLQLISMLNLIICQERDIASARYDAIAAQSADAQLLQGQYDDLLQRYTLLTQVSTVGDTKKVNVCILWAQITIIFI